MNAKALLIGNDINNATESYSWNDLLAGLLEYTRADKNLNLVNKPFPLLYEEIYLTSAKKYGTTETSIKKYIAGQTGRLKPNIVHKEILSLGIQDILTTNYDLSFEKTSGLSKKACTNKGIIKENVYNLFRYHKTSHHKIWHIHGSETNPKTITLGYEHYSGYLQQMRNYMASGTKGTYKAKDFYPLSKRIKENSVLDESWVDLFFNKDIYILGLNLDFVEMHLWWLFTYRARAIVENRFPVTNRIVYFYPKEFEKNAAHKLEMFRIAGIETIAEKAINGNKVDYYMRVINRIRLEL